MSREGLCLFGCEVEIHDGRIEDGLELTAKAREGSPCPIEGVDDDATTVHEGATHGVIFLRRVVETFTVGAHPHLLWIDRMHLPYRRRKIIGLEKLLKVALVTPLDIELLLGPVVFEKCVDADVASQYPSKSLLGDEDLVLIRGGREGGRDEAKNQ